MDLTTTVSAVGVYRIRLEGLDGPASMRSITFSVAGIPARHLVRLDPTRPDVGYVTISETGQPLRLAVTIKGSPRGTVPLRRL